MTPSLRRGPLSWQQESFLQRAMPFGAGEINIDFPVPDEVSDAELLHRLQSMADRQSALRIVDHDRDSVIYQDPLNVSLIHHECGSPDEVRDFIARSRHQDYPVTRGRPRWHMTLMRHRDHDGRPARTAFALFDHFIADRYSAALIRRELSTGLPARHDSDADVYDRWVDQQRTEFDPATDAGRTAGRFWRRHLDGTSPNRATPLPVFADQHPAQRRGIVWYSVHVPLPPGALHAACRAGRATPFVLTLASIAATTAEASQVDDITLRLITSGRTPRSSAVVGWLNTSIPVRLRHRELGSLSGALTAMRDTWRDVLPYQHTPWEYLTRTFFPAGAPPHTWLSGPRQLLVNFFPDVVDGLTEADYADGANESFQQHDVALYIVPLTSGGFMFRMHGDAADLHPVRARRFLHTLRDRFVAHIDTLGNGRVASEGSADRLMGERP